MCESPRCGKSAAGTSRLWPGDTSDALYARFLKLEARTPGLTVVRDFWADRPKSRSSNPLRRHAAVRGPLSVLPERTVRSPRPGERLFLPSTPPRPKAVPGRAHAASGRPHGP